MGEQECESCVVRKENNWKGQESRENKKHNKKCHLFVSMLRSNTPQKWQAEAKQEAVRRKRSKGAAIGGVATLDTPSSGRNKIT